MATQDQSGCAIMVHPNVRFIRWAISSRLDDIHAGILRLSFVILTSGTKRREIAKMYDKGLKGTSLKLPVEKKGYRAHLSPLCH